MMEDKTKFTKGEWRTDDYTEIDGSIRVMVGNILITYHGHSTEEDTANARLISAAPEMYEMLQKIVDFHPNLYGKGDIEKLLAKARGEEDE